MDAGKADPASNGTAQPHRQADGTFPDADDASARSGKRLPGPPGFHPFEFPQRRPRATDVPPLPPGSPAVWSLPPPELPARDDDLKKVVLRFKGTDGHALRQELRARAIWHDMWVTQAALYYIQLGFRWENEHRPPRA